MGKSRRESPAYAYSDGVDDLHYCAARVLARVEDKYDTLNRWGVAMLLYTVLLDILSVVMIPPTAKEIVAVKTGQPRHPPTMSGIARDSFIRRQIGTHEFRVDKLASPKRSREQMPPKK